MGEKNKCDIWGLSLSLRPPTTNIYEKVTLKRDPHTSLDEPCKTLMRKMPRMMEVDIKPQIVIDLEEMEITKGGSSNSTMSSNAHGKRCGGFRDSGDVVSDDEEGSGGGGSGGDGGGERKKLRLSKEQIMVLEHAFTEHTTLNTRQKVTLARQVNLKPRQVEVWFQNRRARTKLKQTEVDCEYLRKFCETLTEQNRKLQKEVQELRTLKAVSSDQSVVHGKNSHKPGTTLNMCPSCKTVSLSSYATASKSQPTEAGCHPNGILHRPVPLNLKKLASTMKNDRMFESS